MKMLFLCFFAVSILTVTPSAWADSGKDVFENKCGRCHTLDRALNKTKSLDAWESTIARMARYAQNAGVLITDEESSLIAQYLAERGQSEKKTPDEKTGETVAKGPLKSEKHDMFDFKQVKIEQFIDPEVCEGCHSEIFKQWNGSMHSKAFVDPLWRAATKLFVEEAKSEDEILEMKACVKCHTPLGFRSYSITSPAEDYDKVSDLPAEGIFCNWCHNISEAKHLGDAGYEVDPGGGEDDPSTMLGPFNDSVSPFHPTRYSELHTRSEFCGLCHDVSHAANNLPIEETYTEWKNSPYNTGDPDTSVHCQDCHMRQRPGVPATGKTERPDNPGQACDDGPKRDHIWTHYFVGGNALVTKLLGSDVHSTMAVERLKNAADLQLIKEDTYSKNSLARIGIKVINSGAGHYLPTGLTEIRQMWLDVTITDAAGKVLLRSGSIDEKGTIDKNAVLFMTTLGNKEGKPVLNVALADRVLHDHRIPPKGYVIEKYTFYIPDDAVAPLRVKAALQYRSASQSLAKSLLGEEAPVIPVIEMTRSTATLDF